MQQLYVIKREDLFSFGCPSCGCIGLEPFISLGTCQLCACEECCCEYATVKSTLDELFILNIRDTKILSYIEHHPFCKGADSMIVTKSFLIIPDTQKRVAIRMN